MNVWFADAHRLIAGYAAVGILSIPVLLCTSNYNTCGDVYRASHDSCEFPYSSFRLLYFRSVFLISPLQQPILPVLPFFTPVAVWSGGFACVCQFVRPWSRTQQVIDDVNSTIQGNTVRNRHILAVDDDACQVFVTSMRCSVDRSFDIILENLNR